MNGAYVYHVLQAGVNFYQFNMPIPQQTSLVVRFIDQQSRKKITNATVNVAVPSRQYAKTFKTDTMGLITIKTSNTSITVQD